MSSRRGSTDLSGVLAVDKPAGMTSHDVVNRIRRVTGERRVGHAGTLDPLATGLLVVLVGPATRLASYLTAAEKSYEARIAFGAETDTDDAEGRITATSHVPDEVCDPFAASGVVSSLVGTHEQVPPAFSAIKVGGVTAYNAARKGDALELAPRSIEVTAARLVGVDIDPPAWTVSFTVSKGTYIRALARDLGRACGTAAHLAELRRTSSGDLSLDAAHPLEEIESTADMNGLFADPVAALGFTSVVLDGAQAAAVRDGRSLALGIDAGSPIALISEGRLLAIYQTDDSGTATPRVVIPGGVSGVPART